MQSDPAEDCLFFLFLVVLLVIVLVRKNIEFFVKISKRPHFKKYQFFRLDRERL